MNPIELRMHIQTALNKKSGTRYGDVLTVEPLPVRPGEPVKLRVETPDPCGQIRTYIVTVAEK